MKNGMKLKALLLGFSICAASCAVATTAMPAKGAPATVTSAYADETGTDSATEAVAEIAGKTYATLQEAINAAENGATVKLLADTNANVTVAKAQNLTLDLNGFTLNGGTVSGKAAIKNEGTLTIIDSSEAKKGTIKRDDNATGGYYVIHNFGGTMTIEQAIVYNNSGYKKTSTSSSWTGSSLICNGDSDDNSTLTINGGSFEQQNFIAVKVGANGYFTMNGGSITSKQSAVQNWCSANIQGGELNGTLWTDCYVYGESEGKTTFGGNAVLNGAVHIEQTKHGSDPTPVPELTITGGTMNITLWAPLADDFKITVTGGTFSAAQYPEIIDEVKKYTADGCELKANSDGKYQAIQYYAQIGETKYTSFPEALAAVQDGATLTLLADVNSTEQITIGKNITLDLNGKTLCSTYTPKASQIVISAEVTICDSSAEQTGAIKTNYTGTSGITVEVLASKKLTLQSGTIYGMPAGSPKSGNAVVIRSNASFDMKGGKIILNQPTRGSSAVMISGSDATFIFDDGELQATGASNDSYINGITSKSSSKIVINGGKIVANTALSLSSGNITINGGEINGALTLPTNTSIKNGTFTSYFEPKYLATGYGIVATTNADGTTTYGVKDGFAAQIANAKNKTFGKACETLQEAIEAAEAGDTVYLLNDVSDFAGVIVKKDLTIDFGNYTVRGATGVICFNVVSSSVTFKASGKGGIHGGAGGNNVAVCANTDSTVTIQSGTYTVGGDANGAGNATIYVVENGKVNITGGTFSSEKAYQGKYYVLNLNNKSKGSITVSGGTFKNYNPAKGDDNLGGNFVAEGYVAYESEENTYTVAATVIKTSQVTLGSDITMKFTLSSNKYKVSVTLNKNGEEETIILDNPTKIKIKFGVYQYIYSFTGLTPQMINRSFTVNVYNGNVLRDSYTYSVLEYCNYLLAQTSTTEKTKTLIAELLNYGKAAQEYLGADSAELTEAIKNAGLTVGSDIDTDAAITNSGKEIIVSGATLNFSHDNKVVFVIAKDMYAKLGDYTVTVNGTAIAADEWKASGDYYMWYSEGILATAFDKDYTMLISDAKTNEKLQELTISVNAYCATANKLDGASAKLKNLVIATYNYGKAAKAYAAK